MISFKPLLSIATLSVLLLAFQACGGGEEQSGEANTSQASSSEQGLSEFELEHGIGPVSDTIELGEIDQEMVSRGGDIFAMKCEMCHNMEGRMVGPELGNVLERRSLEFVMNMILNPNEMVKEHPVGKELLAEYMTAMPYQNVAEEDARAIVEFLRDYSEQ